MKWAINGFGRIGRVVLRIAIKKGRLKEVAAIHDFASIESSAHLLKYDSLFGKLGVSVEIDGSNIIVDGHPIAYCHKITDFSFPWKKLGVDVVLECTGKMTSLELCEKHIEAGAKRVVLSAPAKKGPVKTLVYGINHETYDPNEDKVVSNASCTTNCLAPVVFALHQEFGIEHGVMTTVHSYTNDQRMLDTDHKDLRRARAGAQNIIPTTTGAARAVGKVLPELNGKIDGFALRVPTPNVSLVDFVANVKKPTDAKTVNETLQAYANDRLKGILDVSYEPIVSHDLLGSTFSSIVDAPLTMAVGGNLVKVCAWYDNEWGYSERLLDTATFVAG